MGKKKVVLKCLDVVGVRMAGPAIRYVEMAKALSDVFEVILLIPNPPEITIPGITLLQHRETKQALKNAHALITQHVGYFNSFSILSSDTLLVIDGYDPEPLEHLELFKNHSPFIRNWRLLGTLRRIDFDFAFADLVLAASPRQADLWMGYIMAKRRLSFTKSLPVIELPFGCQTTFSRDPGKLKERFNIQENDLVLLWGGGIWNWFDPLTLISAVLRAKKSGISIKLLFMGVKHPNDAITEMDMVKKAVNLAKQLGLYEKEVFFHFGWTPYEERVQFLSVAHVGVSTHYTHLETRFSFRTRILDYFWAGLPTITSSGDYLSELIEERQAGMVVPPEDEEALFRALETMAKSRELREEMGRASSLLGKEFAWTNTTKALKKYLQQEKCERPLSRRLFLFKTWLFGFFTLNVPGQIVKAVLKKFKDLL